MADYLSDEKCKQLYMHDSTFKVLVDSLVSYISTNTLSPGEVRSIAVFACTKYEITRSRSIRAEDVGMTEEEFREWIDKIDRI